jgi:hypothetical protein
MPSNRADDVFKALESVPGINDDLGERQAAQEAMDKEFQEAKTCPGDRTGRLRSARQVPAEAHERTNQG